MMFGAISQYFGHPMIRRRYVDFSVYKYLAYFQLHNMNTIGKMNAIHDISF